jgi:hypothetical protein
MSQVELQTLLKRATSQFDSGKNKMDLKKDPMAGTSTLLKATLVDIGIQLGLVFTRGMTRGDMLLAIRETVPLVQEERASFGKYKSTECTLGQIVIDDPEYCNWVMDVQPKVSQICKLRALCFLSYKGKIQEFEDKFHRNELLKEEPLKVEPKVEKQDKDASKKIPPKQEVESESSEELLEETEEVSKKGKASSSVSNPEDSARSWMELGEKRKGRSVLRPMRRR